MAEPTQYPDTGEDTSAAPDRAPTTGAPLWVWVVGIPVLGSALAIFLSMTLPMILGGGMAGGGH